MAYLDRLANRFRGAALERELDDEIRFHLEERTRLNAAGGMSPADAEADARRRFGSVERAKAGMRAARVARPSAVVVPVLAAAIVSVVSAGALFHMHDRIYDITPEITAPVPIVTPRAAYTSAAMHRKIQGTVRLQCIVRRDGACSDVTVIQSLDKTSGLDDEAVRVLREWRFRPGLRRGAPVDTRIKFDLRFNLR
jgi:TonB family protein